MGIILPRNIAIFQLVKPQLYENRFIAYSRNIIINKLLYNCNHAIISVDHSVCRGEHVANYYFSRMENINVKSL